jgi:hypothetical protein
MYRTKTEKIPCEPTVNLIVKNARVNGTLVFFEEIRFECQARSNYQFCSCLLLARITW